MANPALVRMLGYVSEEELLSVELRQHYVNADDRKRMTGLLEKEGELRNYTLNLKRKNGQIITALENARAVRDGQGNLLYYEGTLTDITERQRTETELFNSRQMLQLVLDTIPQRVFWKARDFSYLGCNKLFAHDAGLDHPDTVVGKDDFELSWKDTAQLYRDDDRWVMENNIAKLNFEEPQTRPDGSQLWLRTSKVPLNDAEGKVIGVPGTYEDITERKQMESRLLESEEYYRTLVETSPDAIIIVDAGGRLLFGSRKAYELFVIPPDLPVRGMPILNWIAAEDQGKIEERMVQILSGQAKPGTREYRLLKNDRTPFWGELSASPLLDARGQTMGLLIVIRDITERKRAEEALRASEEKHRTLFEESKDAVFSFSIAGEWLDLNPAGWELFGFSGKELGQQKSVRDTFLDREDFDRLKKSIEKQGFVKDYELSLKGSRGQRLDALITASTVRDPAGGIRAFRGIIRDVTEQRQLEEQFLHSQKMEAIGRLAGGVAHDFNNLLTTIMGNAELSLLKVAENHPLKESLKQISGAAERAAQLTRQLLSFSRKEITQPQLFNLNESLIKLRKILSRLLGEDIDCQYQLAPDLKWLHADPTQIEQVILNLVVNARDAMPRGGKLGIRTENLILDEEFQSRHRGVRPGHYIKLTVSDNGVGMDPDLAARIFEPFYTTKPEGTGLGLSTVYGIVKQLAGQIELHSQKGKGTTFEIYFPTAGEQITAGEKEPSREQGQLPGGKETILVLEDEGAIRMLIKGVLGELGYRLLTAGNGEEAVQQALTGAIDLLITDVVLPGEKGPSVARKLENMYPKMKVIYMSGYTYDRIDSAEILEGKVHFLTKPFSPVTLARKVRDVLDS